MSKKFLCKCGHEEKEEDIHGIVGINGQLFDLCDTCFSKADNIVYNGTEWIETKTKLSISGLITNAMHYVRLKHRDR